MNQGLSLPPEEMRALGYKAVDAIVAHLTNLGDKNAANTLSRAQSRGLGKEISKTGRDPNEVLDEFLNEFAAGGIAHLNHPRFFAFIPSPANYISMLADFLVSGLNIFAGTWLAASGPSEIELRVVEWFRQRCGLPESTRGVFVSGGSVANLTALAVARSAKLKDGEEGVIYCSDQAHSSIDRAVRMLGFRSDQLVKIKAQTDGTLCPEAFEKAVAKDQQVQGRRPLCLVSNLGTTSTGAQDPIPALAKICRDKDIWLHGDGAYGAAAVISSLGRDALPGIGLLDSLTFDPHKWLFQTIECAILLVREGARDLRNCFQIRPDYLKDVERAEEEVNFCDYGIQLTRSPRAIKLWLSLQVFGEDQFRQAIDSGLARAQEAERLVRSNPILEISSPAQLGIMAFRYVGGELSTEHRNQLHLDLVKAMHADGTAMLSSTVLAGHTVLRLCPINPNTTTADLERSLSRVTELANSLINEHRAP
jgi:aromatic-L-amino-acid/L-tryptophan decarboxylase